MVSATCDWFCTDGSHMWSYDVYIHTCCKRNIIVLSPVLANPNVFNALPNYRTTFYRRLLRYINEKAADLHVSLFHAILHPYCEIDGRSNRVGAVRDQNIQVTIMSTVLTSSLEWPRPLCDSNSVYYGFYVGFKIIKFSSDL